MTWSRSCRISLATVMAVVLLGCATVTIRNQGERKISSPPTYKKTQHFFLWGLVGERSIDVSEVCGDQGTEQMQTQMTFVNGLLRLITLGIYAPRTAKVWCSQEAS